VTRASLLALLAELEDAPAAVAKEARERSVSVERGGAGVDVMSVAELAPLQVRLVSTRLLTNLSGCYYERCECGGGRAAAG
jgi:hypothetical protein